jgi:tRNA (adenine57-N1/adenine58-N1)-methyltransferase
MTRATSSLSLQREPLREGELIIVVEPRGKKHFVHLRAGDKFHHSRMGHISHDQIIGQQPGSLLLSDLALNVVCLRLTLEDYILKGLRRRTSIIHPKDLATLLVRGDVFPGARVLEAGIGSGAASLVLLRHLGPSGVLVSYERRQEFLQLALENIAQACALYGDPGTDHRVALRDIYEEGIDEPDLDMVLLDVPEPHRATDHALEALRPGGSLLCWLPTVTQVYLLVRQLQDEARWALVDTRETLEREWEVGEKAMRPFHRMIGHTGFWIRARKLTSGAGR